MATRAALADVTASIIEVCHRGYPPDQLKAEVLARLRRAVPVDALWWATSDPATLLFTQAYREGIPDHLIPYFVDNEFQGGDVNQWTTLARERDGVTTLAHATGGDFEALWNRLPPPLLREGLKVQTPWLTSFLQDPYSIRPAANLRMPKFHFGKVDDLIPIETSRLSNFFAARDGADFPYQSIPEHEQAYLARHELKHSNYLGGGWQLITKGACVQCHAIGQYMPTGGAQVVNGPNLRQVSERFRPEYLLQWIANPSRLVPYTAMPQNIPPAGPPPPAVPKSFEGMPWDQVESIRDTLLNYVAAMEQQLVRLPATSAEPKAIVPAKGSGGGGGGGH